MTDRVFAHGPADPMPDSPQPGPWREGRPLSVAEVGPLIAATRWRLHRMADQVRRHVHRGTQTPWGCRRPPPAGPAGGDTPYPPT